MAQGPKNFPRYKYLLDFNFCIDGKLDIGLLADCYVDFKWRSTILHCTRHICFAVLDPGWAEGKDQF